jgi:hypothetical protein
MTHGVTCAGPRSLNWRQSRRKQAQTSAVDHLMRAAIDGQGCCEVFILCGRVCFVMV